MPLEFCLRDPLQIPVDVSALALDRLQGRETEEIRRIPVWNGNREVPCGDLFEMCGSADDSQVIWKGDCSRVKSIGAGLVAGEIHVDGNAGTGLGAGMRGGIIRVAGNAGEGAGREMRGGLIEIRGDAGNGVGGARPGSKRGMAGGEILIHGNAGHETGLRMRRGLIAVAGDVGAATGASMIAGTILIGGAAGPGTGAGMKRGTILFLKPDSPAPTSTHFQFATTGVFTFVQLFLRHLKRNGFPLPEISEETSCRLYRGDSLERGLGEILCMEGIAV